MIEQEMYESQQFRIRQAINDKLFVIILFISVFLPLLFVAGDIVSYVYTAKEASLPDILGGVMFLYFLRVTITAILSMVVAKQVKGIILTLREKQQ